MATLDDRDRGIGAHNDSRMESGGPGGGRRRFRFMMLNDMHLRSPGCDAGNYPGARERALWALGCVRGDNGFDPADFVIGAGDVIDGHRDAFSDEYAYLRPAFLEKLGVPFLPALGNHETRQGRSAAGYRAYDEAFGGGMREYVFSCGGIGFIVLDACHDGEPPNEATLRYNMFLQRSLDRLAELSLPAFIVSHVPFTPVRDEAVCAKSFNFGTYYTVPDSQTLATVERHADHVIAVLSGHLHLTGTVERRGIHHIVVAGTAAYPSDIATFDVFSDRIDVRVHRAPDDIQDRGANIHGRPRHAVDYIDSLHRTHERYLGGNPSERSFSMMLGGEKKPTAAPNRIVRLD